LEVNYIKDVLAERMELKWDPGNDDMQPSGFLNFPQASDGKYQYKDFFSHYESEKRIVDARPDGTRAIRWVKKTSNSQNHFWDVCIYNMAMRDIFVDMVGRELKVQKLTWAEYADYILQVK